MGGSAFSRCAASSPLHRLSPASSLSCTVSPAPSPLHCLPYTASPHCLSCTSSLLFWGLFPFREFLFSSGRGVLLSAARLRGALSVCGYERKEAFSSARKRAEACRPPPPGRADLLPAPAGGQCIPFPCRRAQKRADLAVRSALRFEGRPGISNPATWKPHRKFSGRWHGEAPALRRSRYPSWSSRRP